MTNLWRGVVLIAFFLNNAMALAVDRNFQVGKGQVSFQATGKPGFLRINGEGGGVSGHFVTEDDKLLKEAEIKVTLTDVTTGLELRDNHMREKYLQVDKFPEVVFRCSNITLSEYVPKGDELTGTVTIHGVTRPVSAETSVVKKGSQLEVSANF
jgi:polyisoprenoid-binding protein YceI